MTILSRLPHPGIRTATRRMLAPADVRRLHAAYRQHQDSQHIMSFEDCVYLYRLVRRLKPRRSVEFGTGIGAGTATIAAALHANGSGSLASLEQQSEMAETARRLLPEGLRDYVEIVATGVTVADLHEERWICYDWEYAGEPVDLVVVDGPAPWDNDGTPVHLPNGDLLRLLPHLAAGATVLVDGRLDTVAAFRRYLDPDVEIVSSTPQRTVLRRVWHPTPS